MKKVLSSLLAFAMVLALFSGVVLFNASAVVTERIIPFINQYTLAQAQQMGTSNTSSTSILNGSDYSFSKNSNGYTVVNATTSAMDGDNKYSHIWLSTSTDATYRIKTNLIDGVNVLDGIDLSNKKQLKFTLVLGDKSYSKYLYGIAPYIYLASSKTKAYVYYYASTWASNNTSTTYYYTLDLTKLNFTSSVNNSGGITSLDKAYDGLFDTVIFDFRFKKLSDEEIPANLPVQFYFYQASVVGYNDTEELARTLRLAKAAGVDQSLIDSAFAVYYSTTTDQAAVDAQVDILKAAMANSAYFPLTGFTKTTQAELDELAGNVNYGTSTVTRNDYSKLELVDNNGTVKLTQNPKNSSKGRQSIVTYKKANGATLTENFWEPLDPNVSYKDLDGFRFKVVDADGNRLKDKWCAIRIYSTADGWDFTNTDNSKSPIAWRYQGVPDHDNDGFLYFEFARFERLSDKNYNPLGPNSMKLLMEKADAIEFIIYGSPASTLYFSDLQGFKRTAKRSEGMEFADLPGFESWTDENLATNNALSSKNSVLSFTTDAAVLRGDAAKGLYSSTKDKPNNYTVIWSTQTSATATDVQQNGNVLGEYSSVQKLLEYEGIRIGLCMLDGNEPMPWSTSAHRHVTIRFTMYGSTFKNTSAEPSFRVTYSNMGSASNYTGDHYGVYEDGYIYIYFNDMLNNQTYNTCLAQFANDLTYGNLTVELVGSNNNHTMEAKYQTVLSDMQLFRKTIDDPTQYLWKDNYTAESWQALEDAVATREQADIDAAKAALKPAVTMAVTENFFKGWTTEAVNEVVNVNSGKKCDSIGDGLNTYNVWNAGDFTNNTTFAANDNFSMTATADFAGKSMGWKNMDRSGTLNTGKVSTGDAGREYPFMADNVKGLSKADGVRFKLNVSDGGSFERLLIGLSNCDDFVREQYALKLTKDYFDADGYINIPFSAFEKAWWCSAFSQAELEQVLVFIVEAYGVTNGTTLTFSDFRGYQNVTEERLLDGRWQYNYTAESWAPFAQAAAALDVEGAAAAKANLVPLKTARVTGNLMDGWTTTNVNAVVNANSAKLCDSIGTGLNDSWNNGDFSNNTTFAADNNFSMTATADFAGKSMGWKNMDRSGTLAAKANGGYPTIDAAGLSDADGIRFKLEVTGGTAERLLIGLSNCADTTREQYAMKIKPEYVGADGYINIPFSYFVKPSLWGQAFSQAELDNTIVLIYEAYGVTNGTKITISDLHGYIARDFDDSALPSWEYNYTPESWTAYSAAIRVAKTAADRDAALALLKAYPVKTVTEDFFKGWTTDDVNLVVTANSGKLCDSIGEGLNINNAWNAGDFSRNTTFAMENGAFTMTATADFTGKAMGWKNMDRSGTLNTDKKSVDAGRDYPFMSANVKGLSKAEGIRFKLEANKPVERILIGLSNCDDFVREMYAMQIKPEYVGADGYINIPFSYFEKAFWCPAFSQAELEQVLVFIVEAYGAEEGTTIAISDVRGYKELVAPTQADLDALNAAITKLTGYDFDSRYVQLLADAQAVADTSEDQDDFIEMTAAVLAITDKFDAVDRSALKANIDAVKAIDETLWANEIAAGVEAYYNLDADQAAVDAAAKVLKRIIDKPETPVVTASEVTDTSITVTPIDGAQYKLNDGEWQDSNVFENLLPNKAYAISAYIPENDDHIASDVSVAVEITTAKGSVAGTVVTISGTERYNEVLTATVTDVPEYLGGVYAIEWRNEAGETVGTGETYTIAAADIGSFVYAVVVSDNALDTVASDPTGTIGKGIIKNYVLPTASAIQYPQTVGDSVLSGADTGIVTGTWSWVTPDAQPLSSQSGSAFDVVFTPDANFIDLYEIIEARVVLTVNPAPYEPAALEDEDTNTDLVVTGEFMQGVEMHVADITFKDPAYLALLRASGKDNSGMPKLVLFKSFSFTVNGEAIDDVYDGDLTVTSYVGTARAGQTVSAWFFVDGKPVNYVGTVDSEGILTVNGVTL